MYANLGAKMLGACSGSLDRSFVPGKTKQAPTRIPGKWSASRYDRKGRSRLRVAAFAPESPRAVPEVVSPLGVGFTETDARQSDYGDGMC